MTGAHHILLGEADIVLTGGIESMSQAPHVIRGLRTGCAWARESSRTRCGRRCATRMCGCFMADTAENCAAKYGISREEQDRYAIRSQQLADEAWK